MASLVIGAVAGVICFWSTSYVKCTFGYDDSLDAFGVHGVGGTVGALLTGVFASRVINPIFKDTQGHAIAVGLIDGHAGQIANTLVGATTAISLAIEGALIIPQR